MYPFTSPPPIDVHVNISLNLKTIFAGVDGGPTALHSEPAAPQDHCERWQTRTTISLKKNFSMAFIKL